MIISRPCRVMQGESEKDMTSEYDILKRRIEEKERQYGTTFGVSLIFSTDGTISVGDFDENREITMDELYELISKYSQIDSLVEKLTKETNIVY